MADTDYLSSKFGLDGQVALVTGASSGIGAHLSKVLAKAGAKVVLCARRTDRIEDIAKSITEDTGQAALAVAMDVTDEASIKSAFDAAVEGLGLPTIILNNAGVGGSELAVDSTEESWDWMMDTNLKGVWRVAREAGQRLRDGGQPGCILNTASIAGLGVSPGMMAYATSKAGVVHMTKALAIEYCRFGVRVNALCPGYFVTEINDDFLLSEQGQEMLKRTPARRAGELQELDAAVLTLVGPGGSFMTGAAVPVDFAHHLRMA